MRTKCSEQAETWAFDFQGAFSHAFTTCFGCLTMFNIDTHHCKYINDRKSQTVCYVPFNFKQTNGFPVYMRVSEIQILQPVNTDQPTLLHLNAMHIERFLCLCKYLAYYLLRWL